MRTRWMIGDDMAPCLWAQVVLCLVGILGFANLFVYVVLSRDPHTQQSAIAISATDTGVSGGCTPPFVNTAVEVVWWTLIGTFNRTIVSLCTTQKILPMATTRLIQDTVGAVVPVYHVDGTFVWTKVVVMTYSTPFIVGVSIICWGAIIGFLCRATILLLGTEECVGNPTDDAWPDKPPSQV